MTLIKTPELIKEPIRALWWKQPYGTLMLHGKIETRVWHSRYQGLVLICTSKAPYSINEAMQISGINAHAIDSVINKIEGYTRFKPFDHLPLGQAIAIGRLVESRPMLARDEQFAYVKYNSALYSHVYTDVTPIKPFPLKGKQGWKKLDSGIWDSIEFV